MKEPSAWQENDLLELIATKREESVGLDFKAADSLQDSDRAKHEISKDVSAFANSAGGVIVYGIAESKKEPHYAESVSPIDPSRISKEWLENVISSRIQPRLDGVLIKPVELKSTGPGKVAYVVVVPQGWTAHQASNKKYYKRFNFKSEPMEDYEVRQTMARAARPAYEVELQAQEKSSDQQLLRFHFSAVLQNVSEIVGHDVSVVVFLPKEFIPDPDSYNENRDGVIYGRIPGEHEESSHSISAAIETVPPLTPFHYQFRKSVHFGRVILAKRITILVKAFDQFGLALDATFHIDPRSLHLTRVSQNHGPQRWPRTTELV